MKALRDRKEAGERLAGRLAAYANRKDTTVLALPRGGVPVAFEVARLLQLPLDIFLVRKLGYPGHGELAFGAIASGGVQVLNEELLAASPLSEDVMCTVIERERQELERRETVYRGSRPPAAIANRFTVLIDDGLATGASMRAAIKALRLKSPRRIIAAIPVAPPSVYGTLKEADQVVCLMTPVDFFSVSQAYRHFPQVEDHEVRELLARAEEFEPDMIPQL
jgi:putative phosphoribosyl transferase